MNPYVNRLLTHIPGGLPISNDLVPALTISGQGYLSLTGETLYLTVGSKSTGLDLYNQNLNQLAQQINTLTSASVLQNGIVELLQFPDGQTDALLPATLYLPSDDTYYVLGMMARTLEGRKRSINAQVAQINLQAAVGRLLDWWGASTGIPRYQGEPDILYAQRIIGMRFRPTQNNFSIQRLFATLGYQASVTDTSYGAFSVQVQVPSSPPNGFVYTLAQLQDILNRVKAGGFHGTIAAQAQLSDNVSITDSVSGTHQSKVWTVGNVTVGKFTV